MKNIIYSIFVLTAVSSNTVFSSQASQMAIIAVQPSAVYTLPSYDELPPFYSKAVVDDVVPSYGEAFAQVTESTSVAPAVIKLPRAGNNTSFCARVGNHASAICNFMGNTDLPSTVCCPCRIAVGVALAVPVGAVALCCAACDDPQ